MLHPKYLILLIIGCLTLAWACKPAPTASYSIRGISEALANNDVDGARSRVDALFGGGFSPDSVSVTEACLLSLQLMQLSQMPDVSNDYAAQALKCYQSAVRRDSVAARGYFDSLSAEEYAYIQLLRQLRSQVSAREAGLDAPEEETYE